MSKTVKNKERRDEYTIIVVGVGGTGGDLSSKVARYIFSKRDDKTKRFKFTLIDGDRVEEKNVGRQPFSLDDVGQFKVDCLQEAYDEFYDLGISAFPTYIDDVDEFSKLCESLKLSSFSSIYDVHKHIVLIGCVDNHRARQTMNTYFETCQLPDKTDLLYVDSANEFDWGTVVTGFRDQEGIKSPARAFFFPDILKSKEKKASELSCGAVNISAPQHYSTNAEAVNTVFAVLCSYFENGTYLDGVTYFNTFELSKINRPVKEYVGLLYDEYNVDNFYALCKAMDLKKGADNGRKSRTA